MSSPPTSKRIKTTLPANPPPTHPLNQAGPPFPGPGHFEAPPMVPAPPPTQAPPAPPQQQPGTVPAVNPRKRRASFQQSAPMSTMAPPQLTAPVEGEGNPPTTAAAPETGGKKKGRTNTPWTAEEEQRLKAMRDAGNTWSEIAKTFPTRTEGSVKKHWYKDMHYAEFAEDESAALREAIKEYEANKWKVIGQKIGKPAKACEQYAKEHFKNL
ncbi:MYB DNA-binding domain-containing protein [Coccidioides immitis RS]|uniref:MYB DNA-binding domain-containing protein n=7 Tax=Coccidioides TaxID=5500 RepID=A0A0E1RY91_COCIM|nr:MYB DNA-binding domain-containing protein [Coccidioides immitis RS]XP_003071677.1 myb family transcription factor [Coccidioides posadasii C735 delta SOWgp]KMP04732.1 MYB DNA-binding domain containing protein [Coccidioides immitis RMSCC 2394]KMU89058.1 MYB DNA-binding domain-containing protein [Coccidioides immitis H538.4]EAS33555.2 MYB DNA-binding domain-containing protein [Coccidioides immitis RS]EER29532.1 myb family transcription factor [Coccidioides posadasii C735 delta SOWgp]|eukprot:XP_003071677.1 myb family transcription factor [Coccidioides posadasii C735 delta SOWgp]